MSEATTPLHQMLGELIATALSQLRKDAETHKVQLGRKVAAAKVVEILGAYRITKKHPPRARAKSAPMTEEEWLVSLEQSPAYVGISIRQQLLLCQEWAKVRGIVVSRKRFINWLSRAERTIGGGAVGKRPAKADQYQEPEGWRDILRRIAERAKWDRERVDELCRGDWGDLSPSLRADILKEMGK